MTTGLSVCVPFTHDEHAEPPRRTDHDARMNTDGLAVLGIVVVLVMWLRDKLG